MTCHLGNTAFIANRKLPWCQICRHRWHRTLSLWQPGWDVTGDDRFGTITTLGFQRFACITPTTLRIPYHSVKSLKHIWRSGTTRWNLLTTHYKMSLDHLKIMSGYQRNSPRNGHPVLFRIRSRGIDFVECWLADTFPLEPIRWHLEFRSHGLTSGECLARRKLYSIDHVTSLHAKHFGIIVIPEVCHGC